MYRSQLSPHLANLPAAARDAATGSITASQAVAAKLGTAGQELARAADSSFVHAMHITTLISAAITLLGALVVMRWMPGRAAARPVPSGGTAAAPVREPAVQEPAVQESAVLEPAVLEPAVLEPAAREPAVREPADEVAGPGRSVAKG